MFLGYFDRVVLEHVVNEDLPVQRSGAPYADMTAEPTLLTRLHLMLGRVMNVDAANQIEATDATTVWTIDPDGLVVR